MVKNADKILLLLVFIVSSCSSSEQRAEREKAVCVKQGLVEGTPEFDNCRIQLHEAAEQRKAARTDAFDGLAQLRSNHH